VAKKDETDAKAQKVSKDSKDTPKESKEVKKADTEKAGFDPVEFFKGAREELDKVVWPSRQQLISESIAVILMVTLSATLIYLVDQLFGWAARQVF
jgi:preprotein translocase subunit SecE